MSRAGGKDIRARFKITGPQIVVPTNFHNALRKSSFKESLVEFFVESWNDDALASILGDKIVYITKAEHCFSFRREGGKVVRLLEIGLTNYFEVADHRMFFHINSIVTPANVVIRVRDSDVLIIALGIFDKLNINLNLWLQVYLVTTPWST